MSNIQFYQNAANKMKEILINKISTKGTKGVTSLIKGSKLINLFHEAIKLDLEQHNINTFCIHPKIGYTKPEIKLTGAIFTKRQDICILPLNIEKKTGYFDIFTHQKDDIDIYGKDCMNNSLTINIKSQLSSLPNNFSTLFSGFVGETINLKKISPNIITSNFLIIPLYALDIKSIKQNQINFISKQTNIEKYIKTALRISTTNYSYISNNIELNDRLGLLIIDFSQDIPYIFKNDQELREKGIISKDFPYSYRMVDTLNFITDILTIYSQRNNIKNIIN